MIFGNPMTQLLTTFYFIYLLFLIKKVKVVNSFVMPGWPNIISLYRDKRKSIFFKNSFFNKAILKHFFFLITYKHVHISNILIIGPCTLLHPMYLDCAVLVTMTVSVATYVPFGLAD
jgi:hypothetical protein